MLLPVALWRDRLPWLEIFLPLEAAIKSINDCGAESLAVTIHEGERFRLWEFPLVSLDCDEKSVSRLELIRACFHFAAASPLPRPWELRSRVSGSDSVPLVLSLAELT